MLIILLQQQCCVKIRTHTYTLIILYNVTRWADTAKRTIQVLACPRSTYSRQHYTLVHIWRHCQWERWKIFYIFIKGFVSYITMGRCGVNKHTNTVLSILGKIIAILTQALEGANAVNAMAISAQMTIYCWAFIDV